MNNDTSARPLYEDHVDQILCTALDVGEGLLINGATVHRTEDTVERICRAFGAVHVEVFCIPSLILAAIRMEDGSYSSQNRRIYSSSNHFFRMDRFNALSRDLCEGKLSLEDAQGRIKQIKNLEAYPAWLQFIGCFLGSGAFSLFFGGTPLDALCAAMLGLVIALIKQLLPKHVNPLSSTLVCSLVAGTLSILLAYIGAANQYDKVMIGTIMLLIPGVAFGTSIRDLLGGDTIAGLLQLMQAILLAAIIAFGYAVPIFLLHSLIA